MQTIIVDDETSSLHAFLDQTLTDAKGEYHFFKDDPKIVIDYVKANDVALAFLDINMPGINGLDLAKALIKARPAIKIAFVTGTDLKKEDIDPRLLPSVVGFLYKPLNANDFEKVLASFHDKPLLLEAHTFGTFDCFVGGRLVRFGSNKSKELLALLIVYEGKSLTMNQAITALWPDRDLDKAKILYRDAVWRLRATLEEIGVPCVTFERAMLTLNKSMVRCDYYEVLSGKAPLGEQDFLPSYDWSYPYQAQLEMGRKG